MIKDSSAAMAGLRFGDQILEINGKSVAGMSTDAVHDIIKQSMDTSVSFIIRDRFGFFYYSYLSIYLPVATADWSPSQR